MIVTNYEGEVIHWDGTLQEALDAGHNVDCVNCFECKGCLNCKNCQHCAYCTRCEHCLSCNDCTNCTVCKKCRYCANCKHCVDCTTCTTCANCNNLAFCTKCDLQPNLFIVNKLWYICLRNNHTLKIGCQDYPVSDWLSFTDQEISEMHQSALSFWKQWKPVIVAFYSN